jgi:hypothetical protein
MKKINTLALAILTTIISSTSYAQQAERLTTIVAAFNTETLNATPGSKEDGSITANISLSIIPEFDKTVGTKEEKGGEAPLVPKPTLRYDRFGAFIEIGGNPEVSAFDAKVTNLTLKTGYGYSDEVYGLFTLWGSYNKGRVRANISSIPEGDLDELDYKSSTVSFTYGYRFFESLVPFVSLGYGTLTSSLLTIQDKSLVEADYSGRLFTAGLSYSTSKDVSFNVEVNVVDGIMTNPRLGLNILF